MDPETCTAVAPSPWTSPEAMGNAGWMKLVTIPPSEWQPRQFAVVGLVTSTPKAACFVATESRASVWQFAQLDAAKSSCWFLSAGSVFRDVWHCSQDWKWFPLAIGNPARCVCVAAWVATRCRPPTAWQSRQFAVSPPGAGPLPLHSGVAGPGPTRTPCRAFWSAAVWQMVQSTWVDWPVVWQLVQAIAPGTCTAGPPNAWTSAWAIGKKT